MDEKLEAALEVVLCPRGAPCEHCEQIWKALRPEEGSREAKLEEALKHILWIKDCGIDGRDEIGVFRNWPEQERDEMYKIAQDALGMNKERS